jgi:hypothetical protein
VSQSRPSLNSFNLYTGRYSSDGEVLPVDYQLLEAMLDQRQQQQEQTQHYLSNPGGAGARQSVSSAALMWKPVERRGLTALGLNSDELARNGYLLRVRRLGFDYLKPAGVGRTMEAVLEDEAEEEEEEVEEFGLDEDVGRADFAQDEGLIGEAVPLEEGEEQDAEEEEVDLDDAVEEASEFDYDDDEEDEEDQAREEDPFMVDEEYDESTTTASAVNAANTSMSSTLGLPASEQHTPHPQQHRRYSHRPEGNGMHSMGVPEDESRRRAAAIAEDLEPASSFTGGELGLYQRTPPNASIVEYGNSDGEDAARAYIQQQQQWRQQHSSPSLGPLRYSSRTGGDEEVNSGESEMEVD